MQQKNILSRGPEETAKLARKLAILLHSGDIILLKGDLGAGKSFFARHLIQALCGDDIEVPSPTFTLVQTYNAPHLTVWHFDLYRLKQPEEVYELGIEEACTNGVCLIEWPERAESILPKDSFKIEFSYGSHENERILCFTGWEDKFT